MIFSLLPVLFVTLRAPNGVAAPLNFSGWRVQWPRKSIDINANLMQNKMVLPLEQGAEYFVLIKYHTGMCKTKGDFFVNKFMGLFCGGGGILQLKHHNSVIKIFVNISF